MYKIYIFMQKKLIRILARALHEYVNFVHDPEKQYRSLSACWNAGVHIEQIHRKAHSARLAWAIPYTSLLHIARIRIVIRLLQIPDVCKIVAS